VVQSESQLVLGVKSPDGTTTCWDEDSIANANVSLEYQFEPGRYEVWVGSREAESTHTYRLVLSE
jgi:hypothetical protein